MEIFRSYALKGASPFGTCQGVWTCYVSLFIGCVLVFALMVGQLPICFHSSDSGGFSTIICTENGVAVADISTEQNKPSNTCKQCPDCLAASNAPGGLSNKSPLLAEQLHDVSAQGPVLVSAYKGLADHVLPFSGAPPPFSVDHIMLHISFMPTTVSVMPGVLPWH